MSIIFIALVIGFIWWRGLAVGGTTAIVLFHLTANTFHWLNFSTIDILSVQFAGLPFLFAHLALLAVLVVIQKGILYAMKEEKECRIM